MSVHISEARWRNTGELAVSADTTCTKESGTLLLARYWCAWEKLTILKIGTPLLYVYKTEPLYVWYFSCLFSRLLASSLTTFSTSLFANAIACNGIAADSGPLGPGSPPFLLKKWTFVLDHVDLTINIRHYLFLHVLKFRAFKFRTGLTVQKLFDVENFLNYGRLQ